MAQLDYETAAAAYDAARALPYKAFENWKSVLTPYVETQSMTSPHEFRQRTRNLIWFPRRDRLDQGITAQKGSLQ